VLGLEFSHEVSEMLNTAKWHSVVHGDSNTGVEAVTPDLNDSDLFSFCHEKFFEILVATSNSENDVNLGSVGVIGNL